MAGRKRAPEGEGATTRTVKVAKTGDSTATSKAAHKGKKGPKAAPPVSEFKSRALPLHVNLTHTPPTIPDEETIPAATADPGFICSLSLQPSSFSTGTSGWKGSKRIVVEMPDSNGGESKEKVNVMLTINATVVGSKQAKSEDVANEVEEDTAVGEGEGGP